MTTHPALPGLLLATASDSWDTWYGWTRHVLADLCDDLGRPAPWLRRGLHPKALAAALVRERRGRRRWSYLGLRHAFRLVRRHLAGGGAPPGVGACVDRERRRFRRRALCLFPGVRVACPRCEGVGAWPGVGCVTCRDAGTVTVPAPDLLPRESGRHRRGRTKRWRVRVEEDAGTGASRLHAYPVWQAFEMIREARRRRGTP